MVRMNDIFLVVTTELKRAEQQYQDAEEQMNRLVRRRNNGESIMALELEDALCTFKYHEGVLAGIHRLIDGVKATKA